MLTTIATNVDVTFSAVTLTGDVQYDAERHLLNLTDPCGPGDVMTTNLDAYGYYADGNIVYIKDWSEHTGLAKSLEAAGIVEIRRALNVGPFRSRAYEVKVLLTRPALHVPELQAA